MSEASDLNDRSSPKSILKKPRDKPKQKSFQWDEMNILATYHPADKTYGHMKIDEPKTPFVYETDDGTGSTYGATFSAEDLAARLAVASHGNDEDKFPGDPHALDLTDPVEAEHQRRFREKRRLHYNEFMAAKMARDQPANDEDEDDPDLERAAQEAIRNARLNAALSRMPPSPSSSNRERRSRSPQP